MRSMCCNCPESTYDGRQCRSTERHISTSLLIWRYPHSMTGGPWYNIQLSVTIDGRYSNKPVSPRSDIRMLPMAVVWTGAECPDCRESRVYDWCDEESAADRCYSIVRLTDDCFPTTLDACRTRRTLSYAYGSECRRDCCRNNATNGSEEWPSMSSFDCSWGFSQLEDGSLSSIRS